MPESPWSNADQAGHNWSQYRQMEVDKDGTLVPRLATAWRWRDAVELIKTAEGRVDVVTELSPLETLRVAQSAFAKVVKTQGAFMSVFGMFNMRKVERHTHDQAYFLFLYNPIKLHAVNKTVEFVPYINTILTLDETGMTEQHWSVRKQGAAMQE